MMAKTYRPDEYRAGRRLLILLDLVNKFHLAVLISVVDFLVDSESTE